MPFQFTGDAPEIGSSSGAFRPFAFAQPLKPNAQSIATSLFGNTSAFSSTVSPWSSLSSSAHLGPSPTRRDSHAEHDARDAAQQQASTLRGDISSITKSFRFSSATSAVVGLAVKALPPAPDAFLGIKKPSAFYNAMQSAIHNELDHRKWEAWRDSQLAQDLVRLVAAGTSKTDVKRALSIGAFAGNVPSHDSGEEFGEWMWTKIWQLKHDFEAGWKIAGKDDTSYFGFGKPTRTNPQKQQDNGAFADGRYVDGIFMDGKGREPERCCDPLPHEEAHSSFVSDGNDAQMPFRFLELPAELRIWIYKLALAPGLMTLRSCAHHLPYGTSPILAPGLLATCKQIKEEAADLLLENTYVVNLYLSYTGTTRVLHRQQMPDHVLPRITTLILVINASQFAHTEVDWTPLARLTSLKRLSIAGIEGRPGARDARQWLPVVEEIVARIPSGCNIDVESGGELVDQHMKELMYLIQKKGPSKLHDERPGEVKRTEVNTLEFSLAEAIKKGVQGSKSGEEFAMKRSMWVHESNGG